MDKRTEFKLRFVDNLTCEDWTMILRTSEPHTEEEILALIDVYAARAKADDPDCFCPVDILDYLCDEQGWNWEDMDYREVVIKDGDWRGE